MKCTESPKWAAWVWSVRQAFTGRNLALVGGLMLAAGCQVIPKTTAPAAPPPAPTPEPSATALPTDSGRHRIALLVPMGGDTAAVGQAIANATTMALLDTSADNLRITTYDTSAGVSAAARKAIADGNKLILGPLMANGVPAVQAVARPAGVPVISFSNDTSVAGPDVFVIGHVPEQSVRRSVQYARARGSNR
ncbi:MAG: penicillin-binding protein activator, partial [Alphaproteobacteria bacterium HGW-Alphaproteobacteria-16]